MKRSPCAHAWSLAVWVILILLSFMFVNEVQAETRQHARQKSSSLPEVLTLDEVARLLRVTQKSVAQLAREHRIPARLIGGHWRFRRTAILDWLGRLDTVSRSTDQLSPASEPEVSPTPTPQRNGATLRQPSELPLSKDTLPKSDLLNISGRGPAGNASPGSSSSASSASKEPEKIGEKKEVPTAEEVSLRGQQVLLKPQQLTLELDLSYTRSEQEGLTVVPINGQTFIGNSLGKQDLYIAQFVARYGLPNDFLAVASLPLIHDRREFTATVPGTSLTDETTDNRTETGDLFLALRHTTVKEGVGYPEVILSLQGLVPTHKSSYGIGGGITLIKRVDPVALFASFNYVHIFSREFNDVTRLQTENIFSVDYGFAFSINESLAMSTSVLGTFTGRSTFDNATLDDVQRFFLRTSLTALLTEKMFVEPFVSFSLNGNDIVTVGVDIPYTFDIAPYLDKIFP
jgi:excisionase family DNA binding protein